MLATKNMCDILHAALGNKYRTLPCSDPAAGRELLLTNPDVLILELSLPGANGLTFLKDSGDSLPDRVIALTPFISDSLLQELERSGVFTVICYPFRISYLEGHLSAQTEKKNPSREPGRGE